MSTSSSTTEAARVRASAPDMEAPAAANRSSFDHAVTYIAGSSAVGVAGAFMGLVFRGAIMKVSSLAIATLGAYGIIATWKWVKSLSSPFRPVAQGVWAILLIIIFTIFVKTDYKYFFSYTAEDQTIFQRRYPDGTLDGYGLYNVVQQKIASYIRAHTDPDETIYVWGISPQVYFLAQRRAATRYRNNYNISIIFTDNSLRELQTFAPTVMEDLRKSNPAYIVQIFRLEHFPELQSYVRDYYLVDRCVEFSVSPYRICLYRRRP